MMKRLLMILPVVALLLGGCAGQKAGKRSIEGLSVGTGAAQSSYATATPDNDTKLLGINASNTTKNYAAPALATYFGSGKAFNLKGNLGNLLYNDATAITTVLQAYDADLTAWAGISPTTGTINTTGAMQAKVPFNSYDTAQTLTAATHNSTVVQMTAAAEVTMWDCETANVGDTVMLWARDAEKIEVVPASGDHFVLFDGTAIGANDELDMAAIAGTKVTLMCTADDTWSAYSETAASTDGGVAD